MASREFPLLFRPPNAGSLKQNRLNAAAALGYWVPCWFYSRPFRSAMATAPRFVELSRLSGPTSREAHSLVEEDEEEGGEGDEDFGDEESGERRSVLGGQAPQPGGDDVRGSASLCARRCLAALSFLLALALAVALPMNALAAAPPPPALPPSQPPPPRGGSHSRQPLPVPTIVVSLDGFRADYTASVPTPNLARLARAGVSAPFLSPSFPSKTFPNHLTLVTGLYPESHGVVGNSMFDPALTDVGDGRLGAEFSIHRAADLADARWFEDCVPVWLAAERAGLVTAVMDWPGSAAPVGGMFPTYFHAAYNATASLDDRLGEALGWLAPPGGSAPAPAGPAARRPDLLLLYLPDADVAGHAAGPFAESTRDAVVRVDAAIGRLLDSLDTMGLSPFPPFSPTRRGANVVVVSDHGMALVKPAQARCLLPFTPPVLVVSLPVRRALRLLRYYTIASRVPVS